MLITNISEIETLLTAKIPEGKNLEYKEQLYVLTKDQSNSNGKEKVAQKHELLKDVCGFLNSEPGAIILGIPEDNQLGTPTIDVVEDGGFQQVPSKYDEVLLKLISTGIQPTPQVDIQVLSKGNRQYVVINVPMQYSPIYSVTLDKKGSSTSEIYCRRQRISDFLIPSEIQQRIASFYSSQDIYKMLEQTVTNNRKKSTPILSLVAYPLSRSLNVEVLTQRMEEVLRNEHYGEQNTSLPVTVHVLNEFPRPTFRGLEIVGAERQLELREDGSVIATLKLGDLLAPEVIVHSDGKDEKKFRGLNAYIGNYVLNYFLFIKQYYKDIGYMGQIATQVCLTKSNSLLAYRESNGWDQFPDRLQLDVIGDFLGPRISPEEDIILQLPLNILKYIEMDKDSVKGFVVKQILNYFWRAFSYGCFPDSQLN